MPPPRPARTVTISAWSPDAGAALVSASIGPAEAAARASFGAFLASRAEQAEQLDPAPNASPLTGHGPHSLAWWRAIATCESGMTDAWRTGFFGLEAGHPVGGQGWDAELTMAEDIDARAGDGAWGCSPVAWANVPGG